MKPVHILFIEENAHDYLEIRHLLDEQTKELKIDWAPNYERALTRLKQNHYDVCLVGYEAEKREQLRFLHWLYKQITIPTILLTKNGEPVDTQLIKKYQTDFLDKGQLSWAQLERSIRYLSHLLVLQKQETKFQAIFDNALEFMALIKPNGILQDINEAALTLMGSQRKTVIGSPFWTLPWTIHTETKTQGQLKVAIASAARGHLAHCEVEIQKTNESSNLVDLSLTPVTDAKGEIIWILVEGHNLSERRALEHQLTHSNLHDQLTGLPNRHLFIEHLEKVLTQIQVPKSTLAVLFLDLDRFKVINFSLGHDMGDWLLMEVAQRLQDCLNNHHFLARSGGDEFLILLNDIHDSTEVTHLATTINQVLAEPFLLDKYKIVISASIGIAYHTDQEEGAELLRDADAAMYRAKAKGKSGYAIFSRGMREEALSRLQLEMDLNQAIVNKSFVLFYQPQVNLYSERLVGSESLIRFQHPQNGLLLPMNFIPILEETGTIIPIGEWVLQTACHQLKTWLDAGLLIKRVSVNLSAYQFRCQNLTQRLTDALENSNLEPECLELEITESFLLTNIDSAIKTLKDFKEMGIRITIDDFGMGYASLDYLKRFPADCIKIDRSFISGIISSPEDTAITVATIDMAHALGLTVIAEGVETLEQRDFLRDYGCDLAQGLLYAAPMEKSAFLKWGKQYTKID